MPSVLICDDCRVPQAKQSGFRESQWENPRPVCNSCATNRAWTLFAADMAACPNAQVVHNHGVTERPTPAALPSEASAPAPPLQWERAAAKKMQAAPASIENDKARDDDHGKARWATHTSWCSGCCKPARKALRCSQCKRVYFCSTACQSASWLQHKPSCRAPRTDDASVLALCTSLQAGDASTCWQALTQLQVRLSEGANAAYSTTESFVAHGGMSALLPLLDTDAPETVWQALLLLTRFVEAYPNLALLLRANGVTATCAQLLATHEDLRLRASAVVLLGTMLSVATELAATYLDLDVVPCFIALLNDAHMGAGQLRDDVEAVACLQSASLLLQIFEHGDRDAMLHSLDAFRLTVDDETATIATILTDLLSKRETMDRRGAETQSLVGQHLYLNVLTLVGLLVHSGDAMRDAFSSAGFLPLWHDLVEAHLAYDDDTFAGGPCKWLVNALQTYVYDWRAPASERRATTLACLDRLVGLAAPFLRQPTDNSIDVASALLRYAVAAHLSANPNSAVVASRVVLASLDVFVCSVLPPCEMPDADRAARIHANIDTIATTLHEVLSQLADGLDAPSSPASASVLCETIKCVGLVAHFGQAMPLPDASKRMPSTLRRVVLHTATPEATKRIAVAALVQWATSGNALQWTPDADLGALASAIDALPADAAFAPVVDAFDERFPQARSHRSQVL
ncbi:hypothetical protein SPRG_13223 [Saprolegnia parasitica CBS 223.65]|uniref:MYND-type domain-containing protein n=1 Tax=Saprolegnia parasitica (strain CBS 223.65) TaxID=695850 RepID=A0A067C3F5_SAPPC|nr:hypothetical protein SPRG_13223 [Saprolegnia parasitica CBS 223.65]KDO21332.1 hypothetical protein SPRG_13223 [Saprolegnia parasitica CBS 223.65]|eukprot:XP_012207987.1 hypothetical protein SPRG_13223 [Saprolegnia parasitica CBS 223.65]